MKKIKVLIIDDSALARKVLSQIIAVHPDLEVVGQAPDAMSAFELLNQLKPDVLTLDVAMPGMGGLEFLDKLMRERPMPVVMVSSLTERGNDVTLKALELGAVDFVAKPKFGLADKFNDQAYEIGEKIRAAARARLRRLTSSNTLTADKPRPVSGNFVRTSDKIVFVGSSTGGTEALKEFLSRMPATSPPVMITQHMPESFTGSFAQRLDGLSEMTVREAVDSQMLLPGHAYIAPGHSHLSVRQCGGSFCTALSRSEPVNRHRPSVDVLFNSAAQILGANALGVIMTGMGKDGAQGMLAMRKAGAYTIAQDEASCVVFGMPKAAVDLGAAAEVTPLIEIARRVMERISRHD